MTWLETRARDEGVPYPEFVRRAITYARLHLPVGWNPEPNLSNPAAGEVKE